MYRLLPVLLVLPLLLARPATAAPAGSTTLLDRPSGFGALPYDAAGNAAVSRHALSANGCYVVYWSTTDDLLSTDDDGAQNVYRQNLCDPGSPPRQVNTSSRGVPARGGTFATNPTISADGRYVAFVTDAADLDPTARGASAYVFRKDMVTGALSLVSRGDGATGAPVSSPRFPVISGNGQAVAFIARGAVHALNADGIADDADAYVRYLTGGRTYMASVKDGGGEGGGVLGSSGYAIDIDDRGANVVFITEHQLTSGDTDPGDDAYERQGIGTIGQHTQLVSFTGTNQPPGSGSAEAVAISGDASRVAYTNFNVWVSACSPCGAARRVNEARTGGDDSGQHDEPFFAQTGDSAPTHVFWRTPSGLDPADKNHLDDLYSASLQGADPVRLITTGGADGPIESGDATDNLAVGVFGSYSANNLPGSDGMNREVYEIAGGVVHNLKQVAGRSLRTSAVDNSYLSPQHAASDDARVGVFVTYSPALGAPTADGFHVPQAVARDTATGRTILVSVATDGHTPADRPVDSASIDGAGRRVAFASDASNLVAAAPNSIVSHVYIRDLVTRKTTLVDRTANGMPSQWGGEHPQISGDGRWVVFGSRSNDLPGSPQDDKLHVYRVRLSDGATQLVDRSTGGTPGDGEAREPDISSDGRRVAFASAATNLGGPSGGAEDVYVRDLDAGTTTWASVHAGPAQDASDPALSGDGRRVAYVTQTVAGLPGDRRVLVRDLARGTTTAALPGGSGAQDQPSLGRDGRRLAFAYTLPTGMVVTFVRDLATGAVTRADVRDRSTAPARLGSDVASIAGNGRCVLFESGSDDLTSPGYGANYIHVFRRCAATTGHPPVVHDTTPPAISGAHVTRHRLTRRHHRTAFVFTLSEPASTRISIARCRRHCTVERTLTRPGTARGRNRVTFNARRLKPGPYRATLVATDRAGNRSRPVRVRFVVVRRH